MFKKIGFKPDGGQFVKSQKLHLCYAVSQNKGMRITSIDLKVVKESFFEISNSSLILTQLLAVGESLLCDYPMVVDYILEIKLTKRKKI